MSRLVILVDGIVRAFAKRITPDVSWTLYSAWLRARRPRLRVLHLRQPYDWVDIFSNRAEPYEALQQEMEGQLRGELADGGLPDSVVFLGFSLGGLTALSLASRWEELAGGFPRRMAFITFGAPYAGANLLDPLFVKSSISYAERIYNLEQTKRQARQLAAYAENCRLTVLAHSIKGDEMVSERNAIMIADWLYFTGLEPQLQCRSYSLDPQTLIQPHNTLMQNHIALAYIDGLLDGLLPPLVPGAYTPLSRKDIRRLRQLAEAQPAPRSQPATGDGGPA